jgi:hypothetical protein
VSACHLVRPHSQTVVASVAAPLGTPYIYKRKKVINEKQFLQSQLSLAYYSQQNPPPT